MFDLDWNYSFHIRYITEKKKKRLQYVSDMYKESNINISHLGDLLEFLGIDEGLSLEARVDEGR